MLFLCAEELHSCPETIRNTSVSHALELGDIFHHSHELGLTDMSKIEPFLSIFSTETNIKVMMGFLSVCIKQACSLIFGDDEYDDL